MISSLSLAAASMREWPSDLRWDEILRLADGGVSYDKFRQLPLGIPLHEVLRRVGPPRKIMLDGPGILAIFYSDPRNPEQDLHLRVVGGLLMDKYILDE